jgi:hypothetical protein
VSIGIVPITSRTPVAERRVVAERLVEHDAHTGSARHALSVDMRASGAQAVDRRST